MKQEELLRHMADNLEVGNPAGHGLLYKGMVSRTKRPENISIHAPQYYELAPKTVVINGIEVDRGVDFEPKKGQEYFEPVINNDELHASYAWNADEYDKRCLSKGLVFLEKEKAVAMAKAMLSFAESVK